MKIDILTLFPNMFDGPFAQSIINIAKEKKLVDIYIHNLRDWGVSDRKTVDDRPYGGGKGMILKVDIVEPAIKSLKKKNSIVILMEPTGKRYCQSEATKFSKAKHLIIIAGHYEGYDERIKKYVDMEISIGDFILTGGEIPAMAMVDSVVRLLPGVLEQDATNLESFANSNAGSLLEYPQYTRPENYKGDKVPKVLLSGNHKEINNWRKKESINKTKKLRPDLVRN